MPFCGSKEDKVLTARIPDGDTIKRATRVQGGGRRYTTFEQTKSLSSMSLREAIGADVRPWKAAEGHPPGCTDDPGEHGSDAETLRATSSGCSQTVWKRKVSSREIGDMVMERLRSLESGRDVRFASVYKHFEDATQFKEIVNLLRKKRRPEQRPPRSQDADSSW